MYGIQLTVFRFRREIALAIVADHGGHVRRVVVDPLLYEATLHEVTDPINLLLSLNGQVLSLNGQVL